MRVAVIGSCDLLSILVLCTLDNNNCAVQMLKALVVICFQS